MERGDFAQLPEPIRLEDTIAEVDTRPVADGVAGVDPETLFLLRYAVL